MNKKIISTMLIFLLFFNTACSSKSMATYEESTQNSYNKNGQKTLNKEYKSFHGIEETTIEIPNNQRCIFFIKIKTNDGELLIELEDPKNQSSSVFSLSSFFDSGWSSDNNPENVSIIEKVKAQSKTIETTIAVSNIEIINLTISANKNHSGSYEVNWYFEDLN